MKELAIVLLLSGGLFASTPDPKVKPVPSTPVDEQQLTQEQQATVQVINIMLDERDVLVDLVNSLIDIQECATNTKDLDSNKYQHCIEKNQEELDKSNERLKELKEKRKPLEKILNHEK